MKLLRPRSKHVQRAMCPEFDPVGLRGVQNNSSVLVLFTFVRAAILLVLSSSGSAFSAEFNEEIFKKIASHPLQTELSFSTKGKILQEGALVNCERQSSFAIDGNKFFTTEAFKNAAGAFKVSYAYDGSRYQVSVNSSYLNFTKDPKVLKLDSALSNPLFIPYTFLFDYPGAGNPSSFYDMARWSEIFSNLKPISEGVNGGRKTVICEYKTQDRNSRTLKTYQIEFIRDLNYYPIKWTSKDEYGNSAAMVVNSFLHLDNVQTFIPSEIYLECRLSDGSIRSETVVTVDKDTFRINEAIPPERFVISSADVDTVRDLDIEMFLKANSTSQPISELKPLLSK